MDINKILEQVKKDNVRFILLQFTDIYGVVKSVTIPARHLESSLRDGTWFDGSSIEGFARIAESDMFLKPDPETYAVIPWLMSEDGNTARLICDVCNSNGTPFEGDPRYILKRAVEEAKKMGYEYMTGPEMEFFLFKKENGKLEILPHDKAGYFDLTTDKAYELRREMTTTLEKLGINVEATHHEVAIGQHEIDFKYDSALRSADNSMTLRFALKAIAQKHDLHVTFMPKPIAKISGSGMHVHQSLFDIKTGKNAFFDDKDKYKLSKIAYGFIAGQLANIEGISAVLSPTVNSYKRLVSGYEAPVYITWARTNRSALIRIPMFTEGKSQAARVELRSPDPSCNIYLTFAVMLKAGLEGIKTNMTPPSPVEEDIYDFNEAKLNEYHIATLPGSLGEALDKMKDSKIAKEALGKHSFERYLEAKKKEWFEYRLDVSEWEIQQYLETY